jgi:hypothetical protein
MPTNYGGLGNRPMTPRYSPALATSFYADPRNRGKKISELWASMPTFDTWEDAARGDFSVVQNPAFANLTDVGRTNLLRDVYGLSSDYKVANGSIVRAKPHQGLIAGLALGAMVAPNLLHLAGAGPGGAESIFSATTGGAPMTTAAGTGLIAPAATSGGVGMATKGFWDSPLGLSLLTSGIDAGTGLIGAGLQARANTRGADQQAQANAATLAFLERQAALDRADAMAERTRTWGQQDVDRARAMRFQDEREARLAPFRAASGARGNSLASLLTIPEQGVMYRPASRSLADLLKG